jgi:hypothetical protein
VEEVAVMVIHHQLLLQVVVAEEVKVEEAHLMFLLEMQQ